MSKGTGMQAWETAGWPEKPAGLQLEPIELSALKQLFRRFAGQPFKLEQANAAAAGSVSGADIRAAIPALLGSGHAAAVRKAWGEKLYYLPLNQLLRQQTWEYAELHAQDSERITLRREAKPGLALDLFRAACWIAGNGLRLTAKGTIHQKERSKLETRIRLSERDVAGLDLNYPHPDVYSPALAIVLDLLLARGLIAKDRSLWRLNPAALASWLALDIQAMNLALLRELLQRYVPADAPLQHVALRLAAADIRAGFWYSLEELIGALQEQGLLESGMPEDRGRWIAAWLEALCGCGWLELGDHPEDGMMFRWLIDREGLAALSGEGTEGGDPGALDADPGSSFGRPIASHPAGRVIVQPDFELLVPPDVPFTVRFELEACAEHVASDVMSVYRLSRASVDQASRYGRTPQDILAWLTEHAAGVPEPVRSALEQWGREIGRTSLTEALLLSCADPEAADRIASIAALRDKLERIGPRHFLVDAERATEVYKALDNERLAPPNRRTAADAEVEYPKPAELAQSAGDGSGLRMEQAAGNQGWIYKGADLHFYEPDREAPSREELFPDCSGVPAMWWKEMRSYHSSTARQLVDKALEWRTKLALQIGGDTVVCVPLDVEGETVWRLRMRVLPSASAVAEPQGEMWLAPGDWQGIRLILPAGWR
ncbi:helicase-associated domain-containing protein [Paenibacillus macerans]|uniref:helicase-associated domain-containing protein n=1 Tax=Paenibacillus macerans TaxID=44252 RepID=UPI003D31CCB9